MNRFSLEDSEKPFEEVQNQNRRIQFVSVESHSPKIKTRSLKRLVVLKMFPEQIQLISIH